MLSQRIANLIFVVCIVFACAYFAWIAEGFTTSGLLASSGLPSKFFPQLMLGLTALCALVVGGHYLLRGSAGGDDGDTVFANGSEARQGLLMLGITVVCYILWRELGFIVMAAFLGPLSLLAMGVRQPVIYAVVLGLTGVIWAVFTYGLNINLV
ncbi:MAG: tripartite tricarboxylate transporter TctB family protein [Pseudomonadota bacterium]